MSPITAAGPPRVFTVFRNAEEDDIVNKQLCLLKLLEKNFLGGDIYEKRRHVNEKWPSVSLS